MRLEFGVNPPCLTDEVRVIGADDNARMIWMLSMEPDEVFAIERRHRAPKADGERQNFLVVDGLFCLSGFGHGQYIVSESP